MCVSGFFIYTFILILELVNSSKEVSICDIKMGKFNMKLEAVMHFEVEN